MEYALYWKSQYGTEEIDTAKTRAEAIRLRREYQMAYGSGTIKIKMRPSRR